MAEKRLKRSTLQMKLEILEVISDGNYYSYSYIEKKINSFWNTIKAQCDELEVFKSIIIEDSKVKITTLGLEHLETIKFKLK